MSQLAIVIPYFKIDFFEKCLQSLSEQTCGDFSVYIGDDHSPTNPLPIIEKYANQLNIIYKKFDENLGQKSLSKQWDRCIALTKGEEWLMLLGDDDMLSDNLVKTFYDHLDLINEKQLNVARSNVTKIDENDKIIYKYKFPAYETAAQSYIKKLTGLYHVSLPEYIFRRSLYEQYGFKDFPYAFGSDNVAWLEFSEGKSLYNLPESICFMRNSPVNISGSKQDAKGKVLGRYLSKRYIIENLFQYFNARQKKTIIFKAYQEMLFCGQKSYAGRWKFLKLTAKDLSISDIIILFFFNYKHKWKRLKKILSSSDPHEQRYY